MGEMAYSRQLVRGDKKEMALLKRHSSEQLFGAQIAAKAADEAIKAITLAESYGASWVDLNCGCPIYEATRRGLGAELLKRPDSLAKLVERIVKGKSSDIPFTVKIRLGPSDDRVNVDRVVQGLVGAGAAAVSIHGRTMTQRYTRPSDWFKISAMGQLYGGGGSVPIVGNGDILAVYEAHDRLALGGVDSLMVGRGALIKPWIFKEYAAGEELFPTAKERISFYHTLASFFKEHFGSDDFAKRHTMYFLPWHFEWFCRYRHLPFELFGQQSRAAPLIQNSRFVDDVLAASPQHDVYFPQDPLERLLRCDDQAVHQAIASHLWDASTADDAVLVLERFAAKADEAGQLDRSDKLNPVIAAFPSSSGESTWEVGGAGPRATGTNNNSTALKAKSQRQRDLSSRWAPLEMSQHLALVEMRAGKVLEDNPHPEANSLTVNKVDVGTGTPLTIITGRGPTSPSLRGETVVVITNLKSRSLLNVISEGLIVFAHDGSEEHWAPLLCPSANPGTPIIIPGVTKMALGTTVSPNRAARAWRASHQALTTNEEGDAVFGEKSLLPRCFAAIKSGVLA
jgi:tRNA-dihydrouridine synthase 3